MNTAYKHLDSQLRIAELTIGQWVGVLIGMGIGLAWALYISPFGDLLTISSAIYIAALPIGAAVSASFTEFDPWLLLRAAITWRRLEGRFVPGPGESPIGYVLTADPYERPVHDAGEGLAELDLASLWEGAA